MVEPAHIKSPKTFSSSVKHSGFFFLITLHIGWVEEKGQYPNFKVGGIFGFPSNSRKNCIAEVSGKTNTLKQMPM